MIILQKQKLIDCLSLLSVASQSPVRVVSMMMRMMPYMRKTLVA